jgi:hypothetical protein
MLGVSAAIAVPFVVLKYALHRLGWELVEITTLHGSVVTGALFVLGFILSATIADYKESEKIPAEIAAIIHDMHDDVTAISNAYPKLKKSVFDRKLYDIASAVGDDVRNKTYHTQADISALSELLAGMEKAGVPANYIVKLKQQQAQLTRVLLRVVYIQRIRFLPSATVLARVIVVLTLGLLVVTEIEPFYGGLALASIISLIFIYVLRLLEVIAVPFHPEGKTQDDVSMFLVDQAAERLKTHKVRQARA